MGLAPRWHKVVRDLTGHRLKTVLVVLSIAVGIFAVGVVMGGRGVLTARVRHRLPLVERHLRRSSTRATSTSRCCVTSRPEATCAPSTDGGRWRCATPATRHPASSTAGLADDAGLGVARLRQHQGAEAHPRRVGVVAARPGRDRAREERAARREARDRSRRSRSRPTTRRACRCASSATRTTSTRFRRSSRTWSSATSRCRTLARAQAAREVQLPRALARPRALADGGEPHRRRRAGPGSGARRRPGASHDRSQARQPLPRRHLQGAVAAAARDGRDGARAVGVPRGDDDLGADGPAGQADRHHEGGRRSGEPGHGDVPDARGDLRAAGGGRGCSARTVGGAVVHHVRGRAAQLPHHRLHAAGVRHRHRGRCRPARAAGGRHLPGAHGAHGRASSRRCRRRASRRTSGTGSSTACSG